MQAGLYVSNSDIDPLYYDFSQSSINLHVNKGNISCKLNTCKTSLIKCL